MAARGGCGGGDDGFRDLLAGLRERYEALVEEARVLRKEKKELSEENKKLRAAEEVGNGATPKGFAAAPGVTKRHVNNSLDATAEPEPGAVMVSPVLPGSVPAYANVRPVSVPASPMQAPALQSNNLVPQSSRHSKGPDPQQSGTVTVQAIKAHRLAGAGGGRPGAQLRSIASVRVEAGESHTTPVQEGSDPVWGTWEASIPVKATDQLLELEVFESAEGDAPGRSLGRTSLQIRGLAPDIPQKRREALLPGGGLLEFEVNWHPKIAGRFSSSSPAQAASMLWGRNVSKVAKRVAGTQAKKTKLLPEVSKDAFCEQVTERNARRFRGIFGIDEGTCETSDITAEALLDVLHRRGMKKVDLRWVAAAIEQLKDVAGQQGNESQRFPLVGIVPKEEEREKITSINFNVFAEVIHLADLPDHVEPEFYNAILTMQEVLLAQDVEEVIAKLARARIEEPIEISDREKRSMIQMLWLNVSVTLAVLLSVVCLGISMDHWVESDLWIVIEAICTLIFITEISFKVSVFGVSEYACGSEKYWNWGDVTITVISVIDLTLTLIKRFATSSADFSYGRLTMAMRVFRLLRMARVLKMLRTPLVRELSNMLVGFILGSPALFWTLFILWGVVGFIAMGLRMVVGLEPGEQSLLDRCGPGDDMYNTHPECKRHKVIGEEYCGTVGRCMFTVFRCMIGDCSTKLGQSLTEHLSEGYGWKFNGVYCFGMIVLIFGLFNVITAIFVEATMAGLKWNENKQKQQSIYQSQYVEKKLKLLVDRIRKICAKWDSGVPASWSDSSYPDSSSWNSDLQNHVVQDVILTEAGFNSVLEDTLVQTTLEDLDIHVQSKETLFEIMDYNNNGKVTIAEIIDMFMKLRGGLMKSDMVAPWVALLGLRQEFRQLVFTLATTPSVQVETSRANLGSVNSQDY